MLTLKEYQKRTLAALEEYLTLARVIGPKDAFNKFVATHPTDSIPQIYAHRWGLQDVPYICLRLPTSGGKTLLASHAVDIAAHTFMERDYPLVLWLVPTNTIRRQTSEALKVPAHPYREALDAAFGQDRVAVIDIADITSIRPKDLSDKVCIIVATMQTLRVADSNKEVRKVYGHNEHFEPHLKLLPNISPGLDRDPGGQVVYSFVNILHQLQPLVIVDEAHKAVSSLTGEMMKRINPACVIELTATPVESNVLFRVYASDLKAEEMVKLPFMLTEHENWEQAINGAVQTRHKLADLARQDADYIRPLVLIQAEKANQECTLQVVKQHLITNEGIPESEIAVATGEQRELDSINLFDKTCPVNYVITIEALKEGWDCSFAYVFCSVANIQSAIDVEQLLGRVMRMPYARRRRIPELNNAYAHVISKSFSVAAQDMHSRLMNMGFHEDEANANIQQVRSLLPGFELPDLPLFRILHDSQPLTVLLPTAPDLDHLADDDRQRVKVTSHADGSVEVTCEGVVSDELESALIQAAPQHAASIRRNVALHHERLRLVKPGTLSERGRIFTVPRLMFEFQGELELPEPETILLAVNWTPLQYLVRMEPDEFKYDESARTFLFDLEGEQMRYQLVETQVQLSLLASVAELSELALARWLDGRCRRDDVRQVDMLEFCRRCIASLLEREDITLALLFRAKYALAAALKAKLSKLRQVALSKGYQQLFFTPESKAETSFEYGHVFPDDGYAENISKYSGGFKFKKHFYPDVRDLKAQGEEYECAQALDVAPEVEWWVRNVDRQAGSFWLPLSHGRFYPDFVAKLKDGRILVVEYKGAHFATGDDAKEKENIGELWAAKSKGQALFLMALKMDNQGRDVDRQIRAVIGNHKTA